MAMYDNLLANVPTDLWIGGKWRKSSDGGRFDVIDPATENKVASVASATVEDAKAALDAAQAAPMPLVLHTSGGTTGMPRPMIYSPRDREVMNINTGRRLHMQGVRPFDVERCFQGPGVAGARRIGRQSRAAGLVFHFQVDGRQAELRVKRPDIADDRRRVVGIDDGDRLPGSIAGD